MPAVQANERLTIRKRKIYMSKEKKEGRHAGPQADALKLRKATVNLGNTFVRLAARDRRKVLRILERLAFRKNGKYSHYWDRWTADDSGACYLQLQPISQEFANGWRRWASKLLQTGDNCDLRLECLMGELVCRTWIEEP